VRSMQSDYMHWAKFKAPVRFPLTASEVPHFRLDSLPIDIADLDLDGASHPRYAPLRDAIAQRYGVESEQVVAADGTSMANFLAMAALIEPGDEVLVEQPTYEPLLGAASFLGGEIRRFDRRAEDGFRLDIGRIAAAASCARWPSSPGTPARESWSTRFISIRPFRRGAARSTSVPSSSAPTASPRCTASAAFAAAGSSPIPSSRSACGD